MNALVDAYEAALFDLDGVVYIGAGAVPGAAQALAVLRERGMPLGFITNNAARSPMDVAAHLRQLGVQASAADVVTSAQAVARLMRDALPAGAGVFVLGSGALRAEMLAVGLEVVDSADDTPAAVVVGYHPHTRWSDLEEACIAVQRGATWYACNPDLTRPLERGTVPGAGGLLAAMRLALPGLEPIVAGKPYRPLLDETLRRLGVRSAILAGDRLDTDIRGARAAGLDSLLVLSGSHGKQDLLAASPDDRPTAIGWDVGDLLLPPRTLLRDGDRVRCGPAEACLAGAQVVLADVPGDRGGQLDALWAAVDLAWRSDADGSRAVESLALLP